MNLRWRICFNCKVPTRGCLCVDCVRAALVPLIFAGLVSLFFHFLTK